MRRSAPRTEWLPGNQLELLENGEGYYPAAFAAIAAARREVLLETFILFDDRVGRELHAALLQAARNGAQVHVLVDGWGSPGLTPAFTEPLAQAGVQLRAFEPAKRLFGARVNLLRRMHRKLLVVDGEVAFVGGINYSIDHLGEHGPQAKQDYAVRVRGPLVAVIANFCRANVLAAPPRRLSWWPRWPWRRRRNGESTAPEALAAFVVRDNIDHRDDIEYHYRAALRGARERVVIANAYFFPGWRLLHDIRRCARRGVRVDLILQGEPDMAVVKTAASLLHRHLIRAGVRIHEYCERPLHAKVAVVDGRWATIGSSNLDPTSLGLNLEANVVARDDAFAATLGRHLDTLIEYSCKRVELPALGRLSSAWVQVRSAVVFHFLRVFPRLAQRLPEHQPVVAPLTHQEPA